MNQTTLIHGDCMEFMDNCEDNAFDLAIVDPPYGIGDFNRSKSKHKKILWNDQVPTAEYFNELERVSRNQIIWGVNYYQDKVKAVGRIIHDKTGGGVKIFPHSLSEGDIASHSFGVTIKVFHYVSSGNVIGSKIDWNNSLRWHPCQKPIALYSWLLNNYSKPGQTILDTHLGSGTSAIAAHYFGCDFTGIEIDKDYFDAAKARFDKATAQLAMF